MTVKREEKATFGGGCFWCTEAVFKRLKGVKEVIPGYAGGVTDNPNYQQVSTGTTGHAEVVQIIFDPSVISYSDLLSVFWKIHDPTTEDRQGNDLGPQYRSIILYHDKEQRELAEESREEIVQTGLYPDPIVTEIEPLEKFYPAEDYHQDFYAKNPNQAYCRFVIDPKIERLMKEFSGLVDKGENDIQ